MGIKRTKIHKNKHWGQLFNAYTAPFSNKKITVLFVFWGSKGFCDFEVFLTTTNIRLLLFVV